MSDIWNEPESAPGGPELPLAALGASEPQTAGPAVYARPPGPGGRVKMDGPTRSISYCRSSATSDSEE